ncbi:MAG TPA: DsbA family protein [Longimicrobiaceae bacterium]
MKPLSRLAPLAALLGALAAPACAQTPQKGAPPASGALSVDSVQARASRARMKGPESAPVTVVEVSDFQCPYCRRFAEDAYRQFDSAYVKTGKARLVFINYPVPNHPQAWAASEAAMCAGAQDAFWPMHDRLFATQAEWSGGGNPGERFLRLATELKLDVAAFRRCVDEDQVAPLIMGDAMQAAGAGLQGTPTFILNNQHVITGAQPFSEFSKAMDALLSGAPAPGAPPAAAPPAAAAPRP